MGADRVRYYGMLAFTKKITSVGTIEPLNRLFANLHIRSLLFRITYFSRHVTAYEICADSLIGTDILSGF